MSYKRYVWLAAASLLAAPLFAQAVNFNSPVAYLTAARCMVTADFNGDGKPDLAASYGNVLGVLLGNGNATFQSLSPITLADGAGCLAAGDFNGDGIPDLAVLADGGAASTVAVLLGNGDGTFQLPVNYLVGRGPSFVAVADLNGDGKLDLAVTNGSSNSVSILLGVGDGTFEESVAYATQKFPTSIAVADFNGDGKPDLAITNDASNSVSILLGNGDGTFQKEKAYAVQDQPSSVATGDFNQDGKPDLVVTNAGSASLSILLGNGDGTFQPQVAYQTGDAPQIVAVGDVNGDSIADLAVANLNFDVSPVSSSAILIGNGDGTFQAATHLQPGGYTVISDFNGDGKADLAVGSPTAVTILTGRGGGVLEQPMNFAVSDFPDAIVAADFNGDGRPDIAVTNWNSGEISVLLNNGGGTFQPAVTYAVLKNPSSIAAGDFNGDGKLDLAVTNWGSDAVTILLGNGDGTFRKSASYAVGNGPESVAVGDFNGDGIPDLAVANLGQIVDHGHRETGSVSILLGNGDGTFEPKVSYLTDEQPRFVAVADFNGDGILDVAAFVGPAVKMMPGKGDGTFGAAISSSMGPDFDFASPPAVADFNADGIPDVTCGGEIALGNGDGTFRPTQFLGLSGQAAPGDFNGDGIVDLAQAGPEGAAIFTGNGDGTFTLAGCFLAGSDSQGPVDGYSNAWSLAVADFNRDGKPDVAVANWYSANVTVLTNITK